MKTTMKVLKGLAVIAVLALSLISTGGDAYANGKPAPAPTAPATTNTLGISWESLGISWE